MVCCLAQDERMRRKRHTAEEIVAKLRQVDVLTSQGTSVAEAIRKIGVTEVTYGYVKSFNSKLRDELLDGEIVDTLKEAQIGLRAGGGITTRSGRTRLSD